MGFKFVSNLPDCLATAQRNGEITRQEDVSRIESYAKDIDTDHDNCITFAEWQEFRQKYDPPPVVARFFNQWIQHEPGHVEHQMSLVDPPVRGK